MIAEQGSATSIEWRCPDLAVSFRVRCAHAVIPTQA